MKLRIVIPARPPDQGKSRLAGAISAEERAALNRRFFGHVLGVAMDVVTARHCIVVSRSEEFLARARAFSAIGLAETGHGLNVALRQAAEAGGDGPLLALSADLPFLTREDLAVLIAAGGESDVAIAPDRAGTGTNALMLCRGDAIPFRFGPDSFAAHRAAAAAAGLSISTVRRSGLSDDIDTPEQLERLTSLSM